MRKLDAQGTSKVDTLSALKGCRSLWPSVAGLYKEKRELRTGGSFQPFVGGSENRGLPHHHTVRLGWGLSEQRGRDWLGRQGPGVGGWGLVGVLVEGHKDLCPLGGMGDRRLPALAQAIAPLPDHSLLPHGHRGDVWSFNIC